MLIFFVIGLFLHNPCNIFLL